MKSIVILAAAMVALSLAACGTTPRTPKLTEEQKEAQRLSTLKVYDDNSVAFKFSGDSGVAAWAWSDDRDWITALELDGQLYNAKDLVSITGKPRKIGGETELTVLFKDGRTNTSVVNYILPGRPGPAWFSCDRALKYCSYRQKVTGSGGSMSFVFLTEGALSNLTSTVPLGADGRFGEARRELPAMWGGKTEVLSDADRKKLAERVQQVAAVRAGNLKAIKDERERVAAAKAKKIADETSQLQKTVRIGSETNCGTIFDIRLPLVGVQTMIGQQYLRLDSLYGPSATCRFSNGQYVGQ